MSERKEVTLQDKYTLAIFVGQMHLNLLEQLKRTTVHKGKLKMTAKAYLDQLIKAEKKEFDVVYEVDPDHVHTTMVGLEDMAKLVTTNRHTFDLVRLGNMLKLDELAPKEVDALIGKHIPEAEWRK